MERQDARTMPALSASSVWLAPQVTAIVIHEPVTIEKLSNKKWNVEAIGRLPAMKTDLKK